MKEGEREASYLRRLKITASLECYPVGKERMQAEVPHEVNRSCERRSDWPITARLKDVTKSEAERFSVYGVASEKKVMNHTPNINNPTCCLARRTRTLS